MDHAANAMAAGRKNLSREEALGQEASSALLQGGTISDKVENCSVEELLCSSGASGAEVPGRSKLPSGGGFEFVKGVTMLE